MKAVAFNAFRSVGKALRVKDLDLAFTKYRVSP